MDREINSRSQNPEIKPEELLNRESGRKIVFYSVYLVSLLAYHDVYVGYQYQFSYGMKKLGYQFNYGMKKLGYQFNYDMKKLVMMQKLKPITVKLYM